MTEDHWWKLLAFGGNWDIKIVNGPLPTCHLNDDENNNNNNKRRFKNHSFSNQQSNSLGQELLLLGVISRVLTILMRKKAFIYSESILPQ